MNAKQYQVTLDYDIKYSLFKKSAQYAAVKKFCKYEGFSAQYRRSSTGNVHVRIDQYVDALRLICIRAYLWDDRSRLFVDMRRLYMGMDINRLFDEKYFKGRLRRAGSWHTLIRARE